MGDVAMEQVGDWCAVDDCPAHICNGPHIEHVCSDGARVSQRFDNPEPCPFQCGWEPPRLDRNATS